MADTEPPHSTTPCPSHAFTEDTMLMLRQAGGSGAGARTFQATTKHTRISSITTMTSSPPLCLASTLATTSTRSAGMSRTMSLGGGAGGRASGSMGGAATGRISSFPSSSARLSSPSLLHHPSRRGFATGVGSNSPPSKNFLGEPLELTPMPFNAVMLDTDTMRVTDTSDFTTRMLVTVQQLRAEGKSSMWVRVHALNGHLLGVLGTFGFKCHHCEPDTVVMNMWLQPGKVNKVPPYATHLVGIAGLCLNGKNEVLLVKEGSKSLSGWKLPGGYVNPGEEFGAAAVREVEEETGVKSTFHSLLALRHQHNLSFGVDDIYVVTRLAAQTEELRLCSSEIQDARWVPLKQFQEEASHPILKTVAELTKGLVEGGREGGVTAGDIVEKEHPSILPNRPPYKLYHVPIPGK